MTIICALHQNGETWLGADRLGTNSGTCLPYVEKWTVKEPWAAAVAGDLRAANVLSANASKLLHDLAGAYDFTCRLRDAFDQDGFNTDTEEGPRCYGQQAILAHRSTVWMISPAFGIIEIPEGELWADGSGRCYALGAAHALDGAPEARVRAALSAAITYDDGCGGELWVHRLGE